MGQSGGGKRTAKDPYRQPIELWGGIEATVNRVGDRYFDQLERSGHAIRIDDLDLIAGLGVRTVRYPILWERTAPYGIDHADWEWADERLTRLQELGIDPIVGLVHHGSGPADTSLADPDFPRRLAEYAQAVAERYPWVTRYTPVNEPLTTARFSGLYGHWYPHGRDHHTFLRTLFNQCWAVSLAMRAIRDVNPNAQLIQTEDLGNTLSTPLLAYQAARENERRWLSIDLLCGRVDDSHLFWDDMHRSGITESDLASLLDAPCPPDILGFNYYLTSERFLDENLEGYPEWSHGGNGQHRYADVHVLIAEHAVYSGLTTLLRQAWERYRLPLAITESHLGGTREDQVRWLVEAWDAAHDLRASDVDVRAVTAWALFGSFSWNILVTGENDHYEPGAFDVRSAPPRPTAIARAIQQITSGKAPSHPVLDGFGHWHRNSTVVSSQPGQARPTRSADRPVLIIGDDGALTRDFERQCANRRLSEFRIGLEQIDLTDAESVKALITNVNPWAVIDLTGCLHMGDAASDRNHSALAKPPCTTALVSAIAVLDLPLLTFSSDLVFDGTKMAPYVESDVPQPDSNYGRLVAMAERTILNGHQGALVVRTSTLFSPDAADDPVGWALNMLAEGRPVAASGDTVLSPTLVPDLVSLSLELLIDGERGIWHLTNAGAVTWKEFIKGAAELTGLDTVEIHESTAESWDDGEPPERHRVLGSERGAVMPTLYDALARYVAARRV